MRILSVFQIETDHMTTIIHIFKEKNIQKMSYYISQSQEK